MRMVEDNVENAVGHSHNVARVAEDIARQEFLRAQQGAGAAYHHRQQVGVCENAAAFEMSALADALAMFERSEIHCAHASGAQKREIEVEANLLFHQRIEAFKNENLAGHRSEIARVESLAEERHMPYRANMLLELNSAIQDSHEAQRIASDLSIKRDELREELEQSSLHKKQL